MIQLYDINEDTNWKFTMVDHKITKLAWHELSFPQVCTQHDNVKIKCTTKRFNKKA